MLTLKKMTFENWFSYGTKNVLDFSSAALTQVLGANGHGKSSIPLILEEVLYGKNSKGIKKQDLPNRFLEKPTISATLEFTEGSSTYIIILTRKSSVKVSLHKDGVDISSHTSKGTYATIEQVLGVDFKTFTQLIYQSSKSGLDFLTATDTARKAFLIGLFNLEEYTKYHTVFKEVHRDIGKQVARLGGCLATIQKAIADNSKEVIVPEYTDVPEVLSNVMVTQVEAEYINIDANNKNINKNNQYVRMLKAISAEDLITQVQYKDSKPLVRKEATLKQQGKTAKALIVKIGKLDGKCPSCLQSVDTKIRDNMKTEAETELERITKEWRETTHEITGIEADNAEHTRYTKQTEEFERLSALIDDTVPTILTDESVLLAELALLKKELKSNVLAITNAKKANATRDLKEAEAKFMADLFTKYTKELEECKEELTTQEDRLATLDTLRKAFSTSGLVSYKIEYLVKDLETEINTYLCELSSGRFQVTFVLAGEKLNVDIIDNGTVISINALSSGELARVNIATLLSIRKLMASLSKTRINLLFLDEVMGVLDSEGREKLIEILLEEKDLNTFLVSHEYTHPLLERIAVVKEDNISRLEYG